MQTTRQDAGLRGIKKVIILVRRKVREERGTKPFSGTTGLMSKHYGGQRKTARIYPPNSALNKFIQKERRNRAMHQDGEGKNYRGILPGVIGVV